MPADDVIIIACPCCSQKYRVPEQRIGSRAHCKKCGQHFRIATDAPIDEDTLFGWVTGGDPGSQSVLGGTAIFDSQTADDQPPRPAWQDEPSAAPAASARARATGRPRIRFDRVDEIGAYFEFPSEMLADADLRKSFPAQCVGCLGTDHLYVHLLIWGDKLPRQDAIRLRDAEIKTVRSLASLIQEYDEQWFDHLDNVDMCRPPFSLPFPYFVCRDCSSVGTVTCHVLHHGDREFCQIAVSNLSIALDLFRNNGGRGTAAERRLEEAARAQQDNQWSAMPFPVRAKISQWFTLGDEETFKGYFPDSSFSRSEAGAAGLILTDRRMVYKKYTAIREYLLAEPGTVEIEAGKSTATIEITQTGQRPAVLATTPVVADTIAKSLRSLGPTWSVHTVRQGQKK